MRDDLREKLRPMLRKYLRAEGIELSSNSFNCPSCGHLAWLEGDSVWHCIHCGIIGDTLDLAMKLHPEMSEDERYRYIHGILGLTFHELDTMEANDLMDMEFPPADYLIEKLMGKGIYILAGASKIGKSWLVLWLADCVSKGLPVWELKTRACGVLYLSLEDTKQRIQQRLSEVTGGESGNLHIATQAELLGSGFEEQLTCFLTEHPETGFVIIDTLQRIRPMKADTYSYAGDYEFMKHLKDLADRFNITILLVHHTRKESSEDPFNLISGTTGLMGSSDGALVLKKDSRLSREATLAVTGRTVPDTQLRLCFNEEKKQWDFIGWDDEETPEQESAQDKLLGAVRDLAASCGEWQGTATDLMEQLGDCLEPDMQANVLTRRLNASITRLKQEYGVQYHTVRKPDARIICLSEIRDDANDSYLENARRPGIPS